MKRLIAILTILLALSVTAFAPDIPPTALVQEGDTRTYYATYQCTAYKSTGNACADGVYPCEGVTVASNDPNLWNKVIEISGTGTDYDGLYYVHDKGGMATNVVDIFIDDYNKCIQFGRRSADIYIVEVGSGAYVE